MRKTLKKPLALLIASAALCFSSCEKISVIFGDGDDNGENGEQETIYDIAWESKIPDGQWIKGSLQFFDSIYISDTLRVKSTPEGGKPSWYIERIEGDGLPSLTYPGYGALNIVDNLSMCPLFGSSSLQGEGNVYLKWRVVVKINKDTEHEKSLTAEYFSLPRDELDTGCFMYIDGEDPTIGKEYNIYPINMKVGDTINVYTGKIPQDHTDQQYRPGWYVFSQPEKYTNNGVFKILTPVPANKGQIVAVGVGTGYGFGRDIVVTE